MQKIQELPSLDIINHAPYVVKPSNAPPGRPAHFQQSYRSTASRRYGTTLPSMDSNDDKSCKKDGFSLPMTPIEVLQKNVLRQNLTPIEFIEIQQYKVIYYIGEISSKIKTDRNEGYCDSKRYYLAMPNDQIRFRYQVLMVAGHGSFSSVYKCFDHRKKRHCAIKIIRDIPDCVQYAEMEASLQGTVHSPYSVELYNTFFWRNHICFSMELLNNDLFHIIMYKRPRSLHPNIVRSITFQLLLALKELNNLRIVHGDLKPENILTTDTNFSTVKIGDYGTACFANNLIFSYIQSRFYRSPEVLFAMRYTTAIDMWSLGCIVYEFLIGKPLFPANDEFQLLQLMQCAIGPVSRKVFVKSPRWKEFMIENEGWLFDKKAPRLKELTSIMPSKIASLIHGCIKWDPIERMKPEEALSLEWFAGEKPCQDSKNDHVVQQKVFNPQTTRRSVRSHWKK